MQDLASGSRPTTVASNLDAVVQSRWSMDGTHIYFCAGKSMVNTLYSVPRFGGTVERIGPYFTYAVGPDTTRAFAPDITVPRDTFARISILNRSTGLVVDSIKIPGITAFDARWSPNGRWLAVVSSAGTGTRITLFNPRLEVVDRVAEPRISFFRYQGQVRWAPKSDGLYFLAEGSGIRAFLVRRDVDPKRGRFSGTGDTLLAQLRAPAGAGFDVSADGRTVVYSGGTATRELWTIERASSRGAWKSRRILSSTAGLSGADVSDDGREVAYGLIEASGDKARVWVAPFEAGEAHPVGPALKGLTGPTWPRYLGEVLKISFRDEHDSTHHALVPAPGGTPEALSSDENYLAGLKDSGRVMGRPAPTNYLGQAFDRFGKDGRLVSSLEWPDSLGYISNLVASPLNDDIFVLTQTVRAGSTNWRLYRMDPLTWKVVFLRDVALPSTFTGLIQAQDDGRLVYADQPGFFAGTPLQLVYFDPATGKTESEQVPLSFSDFNITHEGRRAVGIVDSRQSDVWMVKNFDTRRR